jgi:hypothetical protein
VSLSCYPIIITLDKTEHLSETADWNFETLREAAIKFPELVALTPVRTNAILTKYTALRSFHTVIAQQPSYIPLSYENAGAYTAILQDAYLDYKNIYKELQLLGLDVDSGLRELERRTVAKAQETANPPPSGTPSNTGVAKKNTAEDAVAVVSPAAPSDAPKQKRYVITQPYEPDVYGIEKAKRDVRIMMSRIASEVDEVTKDPNIAQEETRKQPFMSPLLFKQLLPTTKT